MAEPGRQADTVRRLDLLLAVVLVVAVAWNLIGNLVLPGVLYVPANLAVALVVVMLARCAGLGWDGLGMERDQAARGVLIGLAAVAVVAAALAAALFVPLFDNMFDDASVRSDDTFDRWFVPLVRIPLGTAVFEEVLFRAVLLGALLERWSTSTALAGSAVAFGLWHIVPAWETAEGSTTAIGGSILATVLLTTLAGVAFGLLRLWSRSVVAPILAHAATNSFAYAASVISLEVL